MNGANKLNEFISMPSQHSAWAFFKSLFSFKKPKKKDVISLILSKWHPSRCDIARHKSPVATCDTCPFVEQIDESQIRCTICHSYWSSVSLSMQFSNSRRRRALFMKDISAKLPQFLMAAIKLQAILDERKNSCSKS